MTLCIYIYIYIKRLATLSSQYLPQANKIVDKYSGERFLGNLKVH